jgi:hypothetical protein
VGWVICGVIGLTAVPASIWAHPPQALIEAYRLPSGPRAGDTAAGS